MRAASKEAFIVVLTGWLTGTTKTLGQSIAVFAAQFGAYFLRNTDVEDEYYSATYYYREMGPGHFDINGNYFGDYEVKKIQRLTKQSNHTGGVTYTETKRTTITEPSF